MFGRVWADACDLGLAIRSHKTGKEFRFTLDSERAEGKEGEILCWSLTPVDINCPVKKVFVFND